MTTTGEALQRLSQQLSRVGHPIANYPEPPLDRTELDRTAQQIGLSALPDEVAALWEWQASTRGPSKQAGDAWPASCWLPGGLELRPIEDVLSWHHEIDIESLSPLGINDKWIPALGNPHRHCWIDCTSPDRPATLKIGSLTDPENYQTFPSIADLLDQMTEMLANNNWIQTTDQDGYTDWTFAANIDHHQYRWAY